MTLKKEMVCVIEMLLKSQNGTGDFKLYMKRCKKMLRLVWR